jgi:Ala-tRNA(Pro) deacylase
MQAPPPDVLSRIIALLDSHGIAYRLVRHEPTRTSEESARARGEDVSIGGKAILLKVGNDFKLFVLSAPKKVDSQKIRARFNVRRIRFATREELIEYTGLQPGSVPPFGKPILPFDLFMDTSIAENERIAFNAGSLTTSIIMNRGDYVRIAQPVVFDFSE